MKSNDGNLKVFVALAFSVFLIDRLSKWLALAFLTEPRIVIPGLITLTRIYNTGVAFGFAKGLSIVNLLVAILIAGVIIWYQKKDSAYTIPLGIILGGAVGNIIDRIIYYPHGVLDIIKVPWFSIFNLADAAITIGGIILLIMLIRKKS